MPKTLSPLAPTTQGATTADVRAFAVANGIPVKATGRLPKTLVDAFNKGKRGNKRYNGPVKADSVVEVKVKNGNGRTVVRKVSVSAARAFLTANGDFVGARGRLKAADLVHAVESTL